MACFLVPTAEAVVTTIITKVVKLKEKKTEMTNTMRTDQEKSDLDKSDLKKADLGEKGSTGICDEVNSYKIPFSHKLSWLNQMLWGGTLLLAFEHVWHGEVVPWAPFLTAASDPGDTAEMLHEISTVGVMMSLLVTAVWCVMLLVVHCMEKNANKKMQLHTGINSKAMDQNNIHRTGEALS